LSQTPTRTIVSHCDARSFAAGVSRAPSPRGLYHLPKLG
jgi:hypothetical protein